MLWPVVKAMLGHYRRHPLQLVLVWLGLTLAVSLLVGVTSINQHAQQSYETGETLFLTPFPYRIKTKFSANKIPQGFYVQLRQAGFNKCVPFDVQHPELQTGTNLTLLGVDPLSLLPLYQGKSLSDFSILTLMKPPFPVLVSQQLAEHMGWRNGDFIALNDGGQLGPLAIDNENLIVGSRLIADMSLLRKLKRTSNLSTIACGDMSVEKLNTLKSLLPNGMRLVRNGRTELESLTRAFHTNLTAMGMLSFLVGLFIFYQAMSLSFTQRQRLVGILRQNGVNGIQLAKSLMFELTFLVLVAWICGNILGLFLANKLIPSVSSSLNELYDANIGLSIGWSWSSSLNSLLMAALGAGVSCFWPLIRLINSEPIRLSSRLSLMRFTGKEFSLQALLACACCVAGIAVYQAPRTLESGFAIIILMLVSVALFTPFIMWQIFNNFSKSLRWVRARWLFSDAAASMSYRGVAMMAFMLALAVNIGVETMVGSFRDTTDKWLNKRLVADLYIYSTNGTATRMSGWLAEQPEVESVWWRWEKDILVENGVLQVVSTGASLDERSSLPVKLSVPNYWQRLHNTQSIMVSESMALSHKILPGDEISLYPTLKKKWEVVGIYYDYGTPYDQILMSHRNWLNEFSGTGDIGLGVSLKQNVDKQNLRDRLINLFRLPQDQIIDNKSIYNQVMRVFDNTFSIAGTLGNITLIIAAFGLFFATLAGEYSRQKHFALLRCMGVSGKELVLLGGFQLFLLGVLSAIVAIPLGFALAHLIVDVVMKHSFGWSLELHTIPWKYMQTIALAMFSIMFAGALPVLRMIKRTPMKSLRDAL
ncbi:ABC transporter permease [Vibrio sagamiensis]|uniref:ABC transporter permease n=1 Tax=Vibrio sagamiensis NBRC 104589 TaxID=1219064 RepID=A0A511QI14_9VIBR|nr:FtsX-like permease family protein [Vibrio sagamiensis]PNQ65620.1 ABC transporter permease [Vibrio agarivorans]GEM76933.1 ABC transporter permease [Vibrio sagamiensis NBRC 104589]